MCFRLCIVKYIPSCHNTTYLIRDSGLTVRDFLADLSLDIPSKFIKPAADDEGPECTLIDCLNSFTALERLEESELFNCTHCKQKQPSTKKFYVTKLPKVRDCYIYDNDFNVLI